MPVKGHRHDLLGRSGSCLPICADGIKNGTETDVDCGGSCGRCGNGRTCLVANDCMSGTCTGGRCGPCTPTQLCGSETCGTCRCDLQSGTGQPVCDTGPASGSSVTDCERC